MSRSKRKTPICGWTTCRSDKPWKTAANRILRSLTKRKLKGGNEDGLPVLNEVSSVWNFGKDGKQRFDPDDFPKGMRK